MFEISRIREKNCKNGQVLFAAESPCICLEINFQSVSSWVTMGAQVLVIFMTFYVDGRILLRIVLPQLNPTCYLQRTTMQREVKQWPEYNGAIMGVCFVHLRIKLWFQHFHLKMYSGLIRS